MALNPLVKDLICGAIKTAPNETLKMLMESLGIRHTEDLALNRRILLTGFEINGKWDQDNLIMMVAHMNVDLGNNLIYLQCQQDAKTGTSSVNQCVVCKLKALRIRSFFGLTPQW